ncbi:MAG: hypothetical protein JW861_01340 [Bacteroidales bacterium]|nr:hypothetical protein [Bacteroidales bacterium]
MLRFRTLVFLVLPGLMTGLSSCEPKSVNSGTQYLRTSSLAWIPFSGYESVTFDMDTSELEFTGTGIQRYYENVLYKTDQEGFFKVQEDYYADMERLKLVFTSLNSDYEITYLLKRGKGAIGDWDELHVTLSDGFYYSNTVKKVVFKTAEWEYGEYAKYLPSIKLNKTTYGGVYYWMQERRPQELYINQIYGVVGFRTTSSGHWNLRLE